jgi:HPt (histidine-containing phosphotransfer) domain-containing protein
MKGDRETCPAAGMDGYLSKPIKSLDLIQEVERLTVVDGPVVAEGGDVGDSGLLARFGGDAELLCGVATLFLTSEPLLRSQLAAALSQDDGIEVSRTAHNLMGSVGSFGAEKAVALAEQLRLMGEGKNLLGGAKVFGTLIERLDELRFQLAGMIQGRLEGRAGQAVA